MPELILDRYEPTGIVGAGGQGYVIHAVDSRHEREVAIKVRHAATEEDRAAMLAEARILLTLEPHPNLPLAREDFFYGDRYCIVMDWIEGTSLSQLLATSDGSRLPIDIVSDALHQVAHALDHLHTHDPPVMHLDIKPSNVIRRHDGRFVLVDFGLSGSTPTPYSGGTPDYIAPELGSGSTATPASDIFSLAVLAYELLTGDLPAPGAEADWSGLAPDRARRVRAAMRRGLTTDPRKRHRTATEFVGLLRGVDAPNNLPASLSSFVGRERERNEVKRLLEQNRCVTLVGIGGAGKTRLALEVASELQDTFPAGVWLTELASLQDASALPEHVTRALGIRQEDERSAADVLQDFLRRGPQLLVLDNCEHLIEDCSHLAADLLKACPNLRVIATSREPLRIAGEVVWRVPPLRLPDEETDWEQSEAIRLFCERARSADPMVGVDGPDVRRSIADICVRLDGIPLAIELAAALAADLTMSEIATALDRSLSTLVHGQRTEPRQETLRATLGWSYELLSSEEQTLLAQLSVFAGTFTLDAAEAICGSDPVAARLASLVDRSLCEPKSSDGMDLYRLLEPVRQFAAERLSIGEGAADLHDRHLRWHLDLSEQAERRLRRADGAVWRAKLENAYDDLSVAIERALAGSALTEARRLAVALTPFWLAHGRWSEGRRTLERCFDDAPRSRLTVEGILRIAELTLAQSDLQRSASACEHAIAMAEDLGERDLEVSGRVGLAHTWAQHGDHARTKKVYEDALTFAIASDDDDLATEALSALMKTAYYLGDFDTARAYGAQGIERAREVGDEHSLGWFKLNLGSIVDYVGDVAMGRQLLDEARTAGAEIADDTLVATATANLATSYIHEGDLAKARALSEEALDIFRRLGYQARVAHTLSDLASADLQQGDFAKARASLEESLDLGTTLGLHVLVGECLHKLSFIALREGDADGAVALLKRALVAALRHDETVRRVLLLEHGAVVAVESGRPDDAVVFAAAALAHRDRIGFPRPTRMPALNPALERATAELEGAQLIEAEERGAQMPLDEAVAALMEWCDAPLHGPASSPAARDRSRH